MTYNVLIQAFFRENGEVAGNARMENINPKTNSLFKSCETVMDIKNAYESFWNDLNPKSKMVIFVQQITICK